MLRAPTRLAARELMDDPGCPEDELRAELAGLERLNRFLGAHRFVRDFLERALPLWRARRRPGEPLRILDVATGSADIPRAAATWAAPRGVVVSVVAIDRHPRTVAIARHAAAAPGGPRIRIVRADARALPFADASFDICLCSLALHHLEPEEVPDALRALDRIGRIGFLAVDLVRSQAACAGVWLLTHLAGSRFNRYDGMLSVRRASTWDEYRRLAAAAGIPHLRLRRLPLFRAALERLG